MKLLRKELELELDIESFPLFFKFLEKKILIVKTGACAKVNFLSAQPLFSLLLGR